MGAVSCSGVHHSSHNLLPVPVTPLAKAAAHALTPVTADATPALPYTISRSRCHPHPSPLTMCSREQYHAEVSITPQITLPSPPVPPHLRLQHHALVLGLQHGGRHGAGAEAIGGGSRLLLPPDGQVLLELDLRKWDTPTLSCWRHGRVEDAQITCTPGRYLQVGADRSTSVAVDILPVCTCLLLQFVCAETSRSRLQQPNPPLILLIRCGFWPSLCPVNLGVPLRWSWAAASLAPRTGRARARCS